MQNLVGKVAEFGVSFWTPRLEGTDMEQQTRDGFKVVVLVTVETEVSLPFSNISCSARGVGGGIFIHLYLISFLKFEMMI